MKSLKRTLCLVLALVMVLGLFGIASATSFTDDNDVQYKEAVDVMTGIGAISGMGDGTFNPKGTITRAQAAKLVTYAVLGKAAADRLTGVTSSFTDVTVDGGFGWAIPSIEYLVKAGVINGRGDGTFDPNGEITGYAVGKMLLCALGYGARDEYVGNGWDFQVAVDGSKQGIFDGRVTGASAFGAAATREEVALYCFNTIQKDMVQYISTLDIYTKGETPASIKDTVYGSANGDLTVKLSTGTGAAAGVDDFGAPANVWTYNGKTIATAPAEAAFTFTTAQKDTDLTKALDGYTMKTAVDPMVNGDAQGALSVAAQNAITPVVNALKYDAAATVKTRTGNGTVVKLYANKDKDVIGIIVIKEDLTKVTTVNPVTKEVTLTTVTPSDDQVNPNYTITEKAQPELYAKVATLAVDDLVLVTPVKANAASISIPAQVTGKIVNKTATGILTLDNGNSYGVSRATAVATGDIPVNAGVGVTLWLDSQGFVVNYKADDPTVASLPGFAYATRVYSTLSSDNSIVKMCEVVWSTGKTESVRVADDAPTSLAGKVLRVETVNTTTGIYTFADVTAGAVDASAAASIKPAAAGSVLKLTPNMEIKATDKRLNKDVAGGGTNYYDNYYSDNVKFIFIKNDGTTVSIVGVQDGVQGIKTAQTAQLGQSYALIENKSDTDKTPVVTAVVLVNAAPTIPADTSKVVYVTSTTPISTTSLYNTATKKYEEVSVYDAYINGVKEANGVAIKGTVSDAGFYTLTPDSTVSGANTAATFTDPSGVLATLVGKTIEGNDPNNFGTVVRVDEAAAKADVNIASATFVDLRTDTAKATLPIPMTKDGILNTLKKVTLTVSVLYDSKTGAASVMYVTNAAAQTTYTITGGAHVLNSLTGVTVTPAQGVTITNVVKYGNYTVKVDVTTAIPSGATDKDQKVTLTGTNSSVINYTLTVNGATTATAVYNGTTGVVLPKGFTGTLTFTVSRVGAADAPLVTFANTDK